MLRFLRVYILKQLSFSISVNCGKILDSPRFQRIIVDENMISWEKFLLCWLVETQEKCEHSQQESNPFPSQYYFGLSTTELCSLRRRKSEKIGAFQMGIESMHLTVLFWTFYLWSMLADSGKLEKNPSFLDGGGAHAPLNTRTFYHWAMLSRRNSKSEHFRQESNLCPPLNTRMFYHWAMLSRRNSKSEHFRQESNLCPRDSWFWCSATEL